MHQPGGATKQAHPMISGMELHLSKHNVCMLPLAEVACATHCPCNLSDKLPNTRPVLQRLESIKAVASDPVINFDPFPWRR